MLIRSMMATLSLSVASVAAAQVGDGSELVGQQVQVRTNGILNTVLFQPGGYAEIRSATGAKSVGGTWTANAGQLCIRTLSSFDCYPYLGPFQAGQPVDLVSICGVRSQWTALSTAAPPPPPPPTYERG